MVWRAAEEALAGESLDKLRGPEYEYNPFLAEAGALPSDETTDLASLLASSAEGGRADEEDLVNAFLGPLGDEDDDETGGLPGLDLSAILGEEKPDQE